MTMDAMTAVEKTEAAVSTGSRVFPQDKEM